MDVYNRPLLLYRLRENGVKIMTDTKAEGITDRGVRVVNTKTLGRTIIAVDTVVLAEASEPDNALATSLRGKVPELYTVGDCRQPRKIVDAIYEGHYVARSV